jgi:Mobilization protein NikA
MEPAQPPEDLHTILSRFHTWSGKAPARGNGNGHAAGEPNDEIREIPYEEAIRQHRSRQAARAPKSPAPARVKPPAASPAAHPPKATFPLPDPVEDLPSWIASLPIVPESEPVIALKAAPPADPRPEPAAAPLPTLTAAPSAPAPQSPRQSSVARRSATAKTPKPTTQKETLRAASPDLSSLPHRPARAFLNSPPAAVVSRRQPLRRTPPLSAKTKAVTASLPPSAPAKPLSAEPAGVAAKSTKTRPVIGASAHLPAQPRRPAASGPKPPAPRRPRFSQILANTVQQPKAALAPKKKPAPDRTRRITTRFSPAEERRIEKCAAELGITVSAYLRQCALAVLAHNPSPEPPPLATPAPAPNRKARRQPAPLLSSYAAQPSWLGGWLALLRNRFLGPPLRFSEDA